MVLIYFNGIHTMHSLYNMRTTNKYFYGIHTAYLIKNAHSQNKRLKTTQLEKVRFMNELKLTQVELF